MRKNILMGLGLALSLAGTAAAQQSEPQRRDKGEQRGARGEGKRGMPDGLLLKGITLTEGQRAQIAQIEKTQREAFQAKRESGREQKEQMRAARERGDTAAVRAIVQRHRQTMRQDRAQHVAAIRNILTVEQRVQFDRNVAELQARQAKRAERGFGDDHGRRGGRAGKGEKPARGR